jgi:cell wall assembly regulator SMI1
VFVIVITLALLLARHSWRAWMYPRPRILPEVLSEDLEEALQRFEAVVAKQAPIVLDAFNLGLTENEIKDIEKKYRLRLTADLRQFYRWRNGVNRDTIEGLIPGHRFLPLEEAAELRSTMRRDVWNASFVQWAAFRIFAGHRTGWLTLLDDGCGDGYFYDPARRRHWGSFFFHFAEINEYRFFPTLANFIAGATECYETGLYTVRRDGRMNMHEKSIELWSRYSTNR